MVGCRVDHRSPTEVWTLSSYLLDSDGQRSMNERRRPLRSNLNLYSGSPFANMDCRLYYLVILSLVPILLSLSSCDAQSIATDIKGLMAFKAAADVSGALNQSWTGVTNPCGNSSTQAWLGIRCNDRGRVANVTLPGLQLTGTFAKNTLSTLNELRYLIVANNSFSGSLPDDLSNATGLLQLWAQDAQFSGPFPTFVMAVKRLVKVNLSGNNLTGPIPDLSGLTTVMMLNLSRNFFTGNIPPLPSSLSSLDLSSNSLTGNIPSNLAQKFTNASFTGNAGLCGPPFSVRCHSSSASAPTTPLNFKATGENHSSKRLSTRDIVLIIVADTMALIFIILVLALFYFRKCSRKIDEKASIKFSEQTNNDSIQVVISPITEPERTKLDFFEGCEPKYDLEDLLRASAEMLGKGSFGTAYKAVMESGVTVAVKRLRDVKDMGRKEFDQKMEILGSLRHPNLVPMRAFYYAREEKLLVYDFMPNGSLFSLLHGNRGPGRTPLEWNTRLRIAQGVSLGLTYLHREYESQKIPHGNIKSSNILLGNNFEVCISDFGFMPLMIPTIAVQRMAGYRAPEYNHTKKISEKADVYSFGVLLLELLTGRHPAQSFDGEGIDLPKWVQSVAKDEWMGEILDLELKSNAHEEKDMITLLQIAMSCVASNPDKRPDMPHVEQLIEDIPQPGESTSVVDCDSLGNEPPSDSDDQNRGYPEAPCTL